ncbi:hypothetical protein J7D36_11165 [Acinetobacter baumannii]|uniref:hypothetical protein n=1 Tax=Acinetobacter baumannii TaxID=470 RepID=UPI001BAD221C|nr:hypothetical protein [Acinetobacter baumannii]QUD77676.1 hypothetical protein J7D36_11165 [Acinetobacter baumannii]
MKFKEIFTQAINTKSKLEVTFFSKEDKSPLTRLCAPFDIGPGSNIKKDTADRYHLWDYDSDTGPHTLSLVDEQVIEIKILNEKFEPSNIITWNFKPNSWHLPRDWGNYS